VDVDGALFEVDPQSCHSLLMDQHLHKWITVFMGPGVSVAMYFIPPESFSHGWRDGLIGVGVLVFFIGALGFVLEWIDPPQKKEVLLAGIPPPKPNWIKYVDAPFLLFNHPEILRTRSHFGKRFIDVHLAGGEIDSPPVSPRMGFNPALPVNRSDRFGDLFECGVNFRMHSFEWYWKKGKKIYGFSVSPGTFLDPKLHDENYMTNVLRPDQIEKIRERAAFAWRLMVDSIVEAVENGSATLWGRVLQATNNFTKVSPDSIKHFEIVDWESGQARTRDGEVIYSLYIEIIDK
jgi:hypothetical protein